MNIYVVTAIDPRVGEVEYRCEAASAGSAKVDARQFFGAGTRIVRVAVER